MDPELPFYYWMPNERYSDEAYPSFDNRPDVDDNQEARYHPLRLHRLRINHRESSLFVGGKSHLPARDVRTRRDLYHKPGDYLPPVPN